jgi:kinesin family member 3A
LKSFSKQEENQDEVENVRCVVRVRPFDNFELTAGAQNIVKVDKSVKSVTVFKPNSNPGEPPKTYYFDDVFGENSTQVRTKSGFFLLIFFFLLV